MLLFHTKSSIKYGKPGLYWVNHFTTICEEHFFQECSLFFFEKQEAVSLSQATVIIPTYEISFTSDVAFANVFLFNTANQPSATPGNFDALSSQGSNIDPVECTNSLQVNDAARPGSFVNIYPGDKFYVRTQVTLGWMMSGVYSFTLQNSDQVCHLGDIM